MKKIFFKIFTMFIVILRCFYFIYVKMFYKYRVPSNKVCFYIPNYSLPHLALITICDIQDGTFSQIGYSICLRTFFKHAYGTCNFSQLCFTMTCYPSACIARYHLHGLQHCILVIKCSMHMKIDFWMRPLSLLYFSLWFFTSLRMSCGTPWFSQAS